MKGAKGNVVLMIVGCFGEGEKAMIEVRLSGQLVILFCSNSRLAFSPEIESESGQQFLAAPMCY